MSFIHDEVLFNFYAACQDSSITLAKKLLSQFPEKIRHYISEGDNLEFSMACENNQLDVLHFLIDNFGFSDKLKKEIPYNFLSACKNNHLKVMQFLSQFVVINSDNRNSYNKMNINALETASKNNNTYMIDFLLGEYSKVDNLKPHIAQAFTTSIYHHCDDVTNHLLTHYDFSLNDTLKNFLNQRGREDIIKKIESKVFAKALNTKLKNKLSDCNIVRQKL